MKVCTYCGNEANIECCGEINGIVEMTDEEYDKYCEGSEIPDDIDEAKRAEELKNEE